MASNIVLNKSNITNLNKGNNRLEYHFPIDTNFKEGSEISLSGLHMYYSWFNITSANQNNFFQYKWFNNIDGDVTENFDVLIPDGYYSVMTLFEFFQKKMVQNGHFLELIDGGNNFIYFIELLINTTYYSTEIRLSTVSQTYNFGYGDENITNRVKTPTGWKIPTTFKAPEIIIPSNNKLGELLGFKPQTIMAPDENIQYQYSFLNDITPNMEPQSSYIVTCNLVENRYGIPNNILYSFTLNNVQFGSSLNGIIQEALYSKIKPGIYKSLTLQILDQDYNPLQILDPNMLLLLTIKEA